MSLPVVKLDVVIRNRGGAIHSGTAVEIQNADASPATVYSDALRTSTISSTQNTDASGRVPGYVEIGSYLLAWDDPNFSPQPYEALSGSAQAAEPGDEAAISASLVTLTPTTSTRNVIQASAADKVPLALKGRTSQTADLLQVQDSAAAVMLSVNQAGKLSWGAGDTTLGRGAAGRIDSVGGANTVRLGTISTGVSGRSGIEFSSDGSGFVGWEHEPNFHMNTYASTFIQRDSSSAFNVLAGPGGGLRFSVDSTNAVVIVNGKLTLDASEDQFLKREAAGIVAVRTAADAGYGIMRAATALVDTNTVQLATTAFVLAQNAADRAPSTAARNIFQPTADVVPVTLRAKASQTADLLQFQDSSGTVLSRVAADGRIVAANGSISAPNYTYAGETTLGRYRGGAHYEVLTDGTNSVRMGQIPSGASSRWGVDFSSDGSSWVGWEHEPNFHLNTYASTFIFRNSTSAFNVLDGAGGNLAFSVDSTNRVVIVPVQMNVSSGSSAIQVGPLGPSSKAAVLLGTDAGWYREQAGELAAANLISVRKTSSTAFRVMDDNGNNTRFTVDTTSGAPYTIINSRLAHTGGQVGFFNTATVGRTAAYTQTYSTTSRTHAAVTSAAVVTTAATNATPYGYTQAQADAIPVAINANRDDIANVKQVLNQVIDDLQLYGLLQ